MRARVIAESLIVAVATCVSPARGMPASPTRVGESGCYTGSPYSQVPAAWPVRCPIRQTRLTQRQPLAVTPVGLGPAFDMDNRRRDEDEAKRRQQEQQLKEQAQREQEFREQSRPYSYGYSPAPPASAPQGYYYDPGTGHYYQYRSNGPHNNPYSGPFYQPYSYRPPEYYYYPNSGYYYYYPNNGYYYSRPNEEHRERDKQAVQTPR